MNLVAADVRRLTLFQARRQSLLTSAATVHVCWLWAALAMAITARAAADYEQPPLLTGAIYARGTSNLLFRFKRTSQRQGDTVRVLREFTAPDGKLVARERCTFTSSRLAAFQLDLLQIDAQGTTSVEADPKSPRRQKLHFSYSGGSGRKQKTADEAADGEVLVGDMIPYFIVTHWNDLMRRQPAPFRFIAQERLETVGFKLVYDGETTWRGKTVVRLKMEPTSFIIAAIVDPLYFLVEKEGSHRVLQYDGRTTPRLRQGNAWKDLDAVTIYDWP